MLSWLKSYLLERSQCVLFNNVLSEPCTVKRGVPQGSVLGPLLFSLYLAPLGKLLHSLEIDFHCYADDLQLYMPLTCEKRSNLSKIEGCLSAVRNWLSENFLFLNSAKTEMMIIGPQKLQNLFNNVSLPLDDCVVLGRDKMKNLGVIFDQTLVFDKQIKEVTRISFFHL